MPQIQKLIRTLNHRSNTLTYSMVVDSRQYNINQILFDEILSNYPGSYNSSILREYPEFNKRCYIYILPALNIS